MQTHDQIVEELTKRSGVRVEVERLEGELETRWSEEAESRAAAWDDGEIRRVPTREALRSARSEE